MLTADYTRRFLFDAFDVRGEWAGLDQSYAEVLARHPYPAPVARLLGELLASAALLAGSLKFEGTLTLQARSDGPLSLLMVECNSQRQVRGIARYQAESDFAAEAGLADLMPQGVLVMTVDPEGGQRYQGMVGLDCASLAECLTAYFSSSEQLSTRFWLTSDGRKARGLLLQQLPEQLQKEAEARTTAWEHLSILADTLSTEELLELNPETLLHRLYHEEQLRLFEAQPLSFACSCSRQRSANALSSLGQDDALALLEEQGGQVQIDCQFCNRRYAFDASDIRQLFAGGGSEPPSQTRH